MDEVVIHPEYDARTNRNDIALLKTKQEFHCHKRELFPACLPRDTSYASWHKGLVTGWGTTSEGGLVSPTLRKAKVPVVSDSECIKAYGNQIYPEEMLCAGKDGVDACQGDSGGPLVVQDEAHHGWSLIGIVSWGVGCARDGYYGVYTEVSHYIPWIAQSYGLGLPNGY